MSVLRTLKSFVREQAAQAGLIPGERDLQTALARAKARNTAFQTVIDIGASNGQWSRVARRVFPEASYFLIEARAEHEAALQEYQKRNPRTEYVIAAAGDTVGEIYFDATDLYSGQASHTPYAENNIVVPVTTIDTQAREKKLASPFLLKLDTHGFEVPIFEGARETLAQTALIVVETYNFNLTPDSLRFPRMCAFLEERGFRCIDFCNPMHRARDGAFWQMDLFFAPADSLPFQSNDFH